MNMLGMLLRIIEEIAIYVCGFLLLTQGMKLRFPKRVTLILWTICYGGCAIFHVWLAATLFKFNSYEYLAAFALSLIFIGICYQVAWIHAFVQCLVYWGYIVCYRYIFASIGVMVSHSIDMGVYVHRMGTWYLSEFLEAILLTALLILFTYKKKGKLLLQFQNTAFYVYIPAMFVIGGLLFLWYRMTGEKGMFVNVTGTFAFAVLTVFALIYVYDSDAKNKQMSLEYNRRQLMEQYELLCMNYEEKRKAIHDELQQNALLVEYLKDNKVEEALALLQMQEQDYRKTAVPLTTGILEMDLLLHHKGQLCTQKQIALHVEAQVHTNPFTVNEWCVLFGNLMDNAIEAVELLPPERREISVKMKNHNQMFLMEINNPYAVAPRQQNGHFFTQKRNPGNHGIGLESCKNIVRQHDGELLIKDENQQFSVEIII